MSQDQGNSNNQPSVIQWRTTTFGDDCTTYNEIEKDPYLRERIEPRNDFKTTIDGYKFTVKIYDGGKVYVFRKKLKEEHSPNNGYQNRTDGTEYQIAKNFQGSGSCTPPGLQQKNLANKENTRILGFKKVIIEEFHPEEGWEIFCLLPIVVIKNKAMLILARPESTI